MDVTLALEAHAAGDRNAAAELLPLVYRELRSIAARYMRRERAGHSMQPSDLVHEAYLRLVDESRIGWRGKTHFLAMAATEMRRILVEHARSRLAKKRGGRPTRVTLDENLDLAREDSLDILVVHEALENLEVSNERRAKVVELRVFGGMTVPEVALALGVSERTVKVDWRIAKAWLHRELTRGTGGPP